MRRPCGCARKDGACRCPLGGRCAWPRGCHQDHVRCCGTSSSGRHDLCSYHDGIVAGEVSPLPRVGLHSRVGVRPGSVLTDEQLELERILRLLKDTG